MADKAKRSTENDALAAVQEKGEENDVKARTVLDMLRLARDSSHDISKGLYGYHRATQVVAELLDRIDAFVRKEELEGP